MATGRQKLTIESESVGFDETKRKLDSVRSAEESVISAGEDSTKVSDLQTAAQNRLNASEGDYLELLNLLPFGIGAYIASLFKASKVISTVTKQNLAFGATLGRLRGAINGIIIGLTKWAGVIGVVIGAVAAMTKGIRGARAQVARYDDAVKASIARINEQTDALRQQAEAYRKAAEARADYEGVGRPEAEAGAGAAIRMAKRYGVSEATAAQVSGELAGTGLTAEQKGQYAVLREAGKPGVGALDQRMGARERERAVEQAIRHYSTFVEQKATQSQDAQRMRDQQALQQLRGGGRGTLAAREFAAQFAPAGIDPDKLVENLRAVGMDVEGAADKASHPLNLLTRIAEKQWDGTVRLETLDGKILKVQEDMLRTMEIVANAIVHQNRQPRIRIDHSRNVYPDHESMRRRIRNGETIGADVD